jgi:ubiquinone/menaquinone biosynthesis C-methylase UbiE
MISSAARAEHLDRPLNPAHPSGRSLALRCPGCSRALGSIDYGASSAFEPEIRCRICSFQLVQEQGIWRALPPGRQQYYDKFLMEYQFVRAAEGRGSPDPAFYLALPYKDLTGRNPRQWAIRSRTFRYLAHKVLPELQQQTTASLNLLDLGAGNGWLSYRLARRRHFPVAVDISVNNRDGLGAAAHYLSELPSLFPRIQAELDNLPFADGQFDAAIFDASFHYSENYTRTLKEAIRCLRPGGTVIIADSPSYRSEESGQRMLQERRALFMNQFGFPSDGLKSLEYLTSERLTALAERLNISWQLHQPSYGLRWALRPWVAKIKRTREPSEFRLYTAQVKTK